MPHASVRDLQRTFTIANGATQSDVVDLSDAIAASFITPAAFTNTGAINLIRFGVSNDFLNNTGTGTIALLPTSAIATPQSQQCSVSSAYQFPEDVLKFRCVRLDGVSAEAAARTLILNRKVGNVTWRRVIAAIANGASNSSALQTRGATAASLFIPAAFTGVTVTFQAGDGGTWYTIKTTADAAFSQGVAVSRWIPIPDDCLQFPYLRIVSGSAEGAARNLVVDFKHIVN